MLIKAGSSLLVTRSVQLDTDVAPSVADHGQLALAPDVVLKRSMVQARKGDTAALLSKRYGVSGANLAEWNPGLGAGALRKGQSVVLFLPVRAATRAPARNQAPAGATRAHAPAPATRAPARQSAPKAAARPTTKSAGKSAAKAKH